MLDFYETSALFTPEERQTQATLREFLEAEAAPQVRDWWETGTFPNHLVPRFGEMGLLGAGLPEPEDTPPLSSVGYGLVMYELERADSGLRSFVSVQGSLVMYPIFTYGSEEQRRRYLPKLGSGELIGCFGLTEREAGSDPASMTTQAKKNGEDYVLSGAKMWISCGAFADVAVIWAKDEEEVVRGFIVPTDSPGFTAHPVQRQMSLRVGGVAELVLDEVRVPPAQVLPNAIGLSAPLSCLTQARYGLAWGAMGALEAVYSEALEFAKNRVTFGRPIAGRQLVQDKLVRMLSDHTSGLLLAWRLGRLKDEGRLEHTQVSLAKRRNVRSALEGARSAREILAASGITLDHHVIRHMLNLESVDTYEGTHDIHTLTLGREITGLEAFR